MGTPEAHMGHLGPELALGGSSEYFAETLFNDLKKSMIFSQIESLNNYF